VFWLSTVAIFCQPSILRNVICPAINELIRAQQQRRRDHEAEAPSDYWPG
jgi:hypothetical protein